MMKERKKINNSKKPYYVMSDLLTIMLIALIILLLDYLLDQYLYGYISMEKYNTFYNFSGKVSTLIKWIHFIVAIILIIYTAIHTIKNNLDLTIVKTNFITSIIGIINNIQFNYLNTTSWIINQIITTILSLLYIIYYWRHKKEFDSEFKDYYKTALIYTIIYFIISATILLFLLLFSLSSWDSIPG